MTALADPIRLGPVTVRNRIVFAAHLTGAAVDRLPTDQHAAYYAARAAGGAGLIITEEQSAASTDRPYEPLVDGTDPRVVDGYRRITGAVHAHGATVFAQLGHNGGQSSSLYSRAPLDAPSAVPDPMFREVPRPLDDAGVARLVDGFATVAAHCAAGGFDGVEIQCSQASIVRQFLSPLTNRRTDRWADGVALLETIIAAVRDALGPDRALGVRLQGDEGLPGGLGVDDAVAVARRVEPLVDHVNTSVGVATATLPLIEPPMGVPAGYAAAVPSAVRAAVSVPVIGVGRFTTPAQAAATLASGACDLVGVVRGQIADPSFAAKALAGRPVRRCVGCNQECIARVGANQRLGCVVDPRAGTESRPLPAPGPRRRVLVVGAGPAGLAAATTASARGHDVHLVERDDHLGGQVVLAATAPARGELGHLVDDLVADLGPTRVTLGATVDAAFVAREGADAVVVAIGSVPQGPAWATARTVDVADVLAGRVAPTGAVVVVDERGDHHATSAAELLARRGCAVTILTAAMVPAGRLGPTLERERWRRRAAALGIGSRADRVVLGVDDGGTLDVLHHPTGVREAPTADWVVTALPRRARVVDLGVAVTTVGDALAPRTAAEAIREGTAAAEAL